MAGIQLIQGATTYNAAGAQHPAPITLEVNVLCLLSFVGGTTAQYTWQLSRPDGSQSVISSATSPGPSFTPDVIGGAYSVQLTDALNNTYVLDITLPTAPIDPGANGAVWYFNEVDARSFGVIADSNSSAAVNLLALEAARDYINGLGGGTIVLPPGETFISDTFSIPSGYANLVIEGAGHDYTVSPRANLGSFLRASTGFPSGKTLLEFVSCRRCSVRALGVDGYDENLVQRAGQGIDFSSDGTSIFIHSRSESVAVRGIEVQSRTATRSGNTFLITDNPFYNGDQVYLSTTGALPTSSPTLTVGTISTGARWYVVNRTATSIQLSATFGGTAATMSDAGSGVHTIKGRGYAVHIGGYTTGRQVSNSRFDTFQITESDIWVFIDGSSGTTDIKLSNWAVNNQLAGVLDTGTAQFEHVNAQSGGATADYVIRPTFAGAVFRDCKHELTNSGPAFLFPDGARPWPTVLDQVDIQFVNGGTGNDKIIDFQQDGALFFKGGCQFRLGTPSVDTGKVSVVGHAAGSTARVYDDGSTYLNDATFDLTNLGAAGAAIYRHDNVYGPHVSVQLSGQKNGGFQMSQMSPEPSTTPTNSITMWAGTGARTGENTTLKMRRKDTTYDSIVWERSMLKNVDRYNLTAEVHETAADGTWNDGSAHVIYDHELATGTVHTYIVKVSARNTGATGGTAGHGGYYLYRVCCKNVAGTVTVTSSTAILADVEDDATWSGPAFSGSGANLRIQVTGVAGQTIHWNAALHGVIA